MKTKDNNRPLRGSVHSRLTAYLRMRKYPRKFPMHCSFIRLITRQGQSCCDFCPLGTHMAFMPPWWEKCQIGRYMVCK